ncbi:zinc finger protein 586-like [Penaeus monodon]|uniref:zinc finger protein 586-like n=1 Tax=Penaeus monodon TaxID=6687 RepID=UPI0018A6F7DB|nr:zinc finger protein 586-like [Penaeus monodon]
MVKYGSTDLCTKQCIGQWGLTSFFWWDTKTLDFDFSHFRGMGRREWVMWQVTLSFLAAGDLSPTHDEEIYGKEASIKEKLNEDVTKETYLDIKKTLLNYTMKEDEVSKVPRGSQECPNCNKTFTGHMQSIKAMKAHTKTSHTTVKICNRPLRERSSMDQIRSTYRREAIHLKAHESKYKVETYSCGICNKASHGKGSRMGVHANEEPIQVVDCNKGSISPKAILARHDRYTN